MPVLRLPLSMAALMMLFMIVHMAVNALTFAFPIQRLIMALCVGAGAGVNALLARSLRACVYLESQTSEPVVLAFSFSYLSVIALCSFETIGYVCVEKVLQAACR